MSLAFGGWGQPRNSSPPPLTHGGPAPSSSSDGRGNGIQVSPSLSGGQSTNPNVTPVGTWSPPGMSPADMNRAGGIPTNNSSAIGAALGNSYTGDPAINAQIAALQSQLAAPSFSAGGGGNGAAAALARRIAALQNQGTDIDIGRMQASMAQLPGLRKNAADVYGAQLQQLQLQAALSRLKSAADTRGLEYDGTARGARASAGYGKGQSDITQALANALANNAQDRRGVLARQNDTNIDLDTKARDLYAGVVKLALQKQINDEQAKGAGLGGGGNPMIAYSEFVRKLGLQNNIAGLQAQGAQFNPQAVGYFTELFKQSPALANTWAQQNGFNLDWLKMFAQPANTQQARIDKRNR